MDFKTDNLQQQQLIKLDTDLDSEDESYDDLWLISYADMITLLMAFFIMLLAISNISQSKVEALKEKLSESLPLSHKQELTPFKNLEKKLDEIIDKLQLNNQIHISRNDTGIYIELTDHILYLLGSAELKSDALNVLKQISQALISINLEGLLIEVEGHTDDLPVKSGKYPSNWELSAHRATNVIKYFIEQGISSKFLKAVGYADSRPKFTPNEEVLDLQEVRARNRRVVISITRPPFTEKPGETPFSTTFLSNLLKAN